MQTIQREADESLAGDSPGKSKENIFCNLRYESFAPYFGIRSGGLLIYEAPFWQIP